MPYFHPFLDFHSNVSESSHRRLMYVTEHFKWKSIKRFIYLAYAFSSSGLNYDIFSKVCKEVRLIDFLICELTIGMSYMFMDVFIRQYTRKIDCNSTLNPTLKGVTYGILLQSMVWSLLHSTALADSSVILMASFKTPPEWSKCQKIASNVTCVPTTKVLNKCVFDHELTNLEETAAHIFYLKHFKNQDKNVLPRNVFIYVLVWVLNFGYVTLPSGIVIKIFKIIFFWGVYSTIIALVVIWFHYIKTEEIAKALTTMFDISSPTSFIDSMDHVAYGFRIGLIGVFDFGTMSPYTMIDNAVVLFTMIFTLCAFTRSFIVKTMYTVFKKCIKVELTVTEHYLLFAILPLNIDFLYLNRFYAIYIYSNTLLGAKASLAALTLTMSKLIQSEFRSVKNIYIIGALCSIGLIFTIGISHLKGNRMQGLMYGLNVIVLFLGGLKMAVVMWVYGVQRFSTDVQFWLGFKPTTFWRICWSFTPLLLFISVATRVSSLVQMSERDYIMVKYAGNWIIISLVLVVGIELKTMIQFILRNSLGSLLSSNLKYGPPDPEDRKRRRNYNEILHLRRCHHNCCVVDELVECNHLPLASTNLSEPSSQSFKSIYEAGPSK